MAKSDPASTAVADAKKRAQAQIRAQQRRTLVIWVVLGVILVGLFAALVAYIVRQNNVTDVASGDQLTPAAASDNGGFAVSTSGVVNDGLDASHTRLDVYYDFMCPICGYFEMSQGPTLDELRKDGKVDVYYHPISILDGASEGTAYSTRAASAATLVAEEAPDKFLTFSTALFVNQPEENSKGLTDAEIQDIASKAGVPADVVAKIPDHAYTSWVRSATEKASVAGVNGTPTLAINGVMQNPQANADDVDWSKDGALSAAILAAEN